MDLFFAISLLCQVTVKSPMAVIDTVYVQASQSKCHQFYIHCTSVVKGTDDERLKFCVSRRPDVETKKPLRTMMRHKKESVASK